MICALKGDQMIYYNIADENCIELTGVDRPKDNSGEFYRLIYSEREKYTKNNMELASCLSGVRVRFNTDSPIIEIKSKMQNCYNMLHFSAKGAYGFDIYCREADSIGKPRKYIGKMGHHFTSSDNLDQTADLPEGTNEVTILFPLYGGVKEFIIGIQEGYRIWSPCDYSVKDEICFYGSSITQGGCVGRPGLSYANQLTMELDAPCRNLGFSGSALGEQYVADYIGKLKLSAFVMCYDYNAPTVEHLIKTHEPFYETVRSNHNDMPIIFISHPYYDDAAEIDIKRRDVVYSTFLKAKLRGDNVYYVDSEDYFPGNNRHLFAVDNTHPNDLGHYYIAKAVLPVLKQALYIYNDHN